MKTKMKCLVDLGEKGEQSRYIILKNAEEREEIEKELAGMLPYEKEFITTKGESITGSQIILEEVIK